jgi:hypothetical protein
MRETREVVREEPLMHRPILSALADGQLTVPEIAEAIGFPAEETLIWVMGMRRYRKITEVPDSADEDGYFRYLAAGPEVK